MMSSLKNLCADVDLIRRGALHIIKLEKPIFPRHECAAITAFRSLPSNRRVGDGVAVHIGDRPHKRSRSGFRAWNTLCTRTNGKHQGHSWYSHETEGRKNPHRCCPYAYRRQETCQTETAAKSLSVLPANIPGDALLQTLGAGIDGFVDDLATSSRG